LESLPDATTTCVSVVVMDMLCLSHSHPFLIHDLTVGNKTDVASGAAIAYPSRAPEFLLAKV